MPDSRLPERAAGLDRSVAVPAPGAARARAEDLVRWAVVMLGCSIPVSVAMDNALLAFILCCWVAGGAYREKLAAVRGNPVALAALALFGLHLAGTLYTIGGTRDVLDSVTKSGRLLLIPALMPLMRAAEWRRRGIAAFLGSMLVTLALSCLLWLGWLPVNEWLKGTVQDPVAFKAHITHNVFMAFAAFLLALAARDAGTRRGRLLLSALCAAAVLNVLLMVPGRTGHIVLLVLFTYFLCLHLRAKGLLVAGVVLGSLAVVVLLSPDTMLHRRITLADDEYRQWRAGIPPPPQSSIGQRMGILRNTVEVILENPVLGVGTGGFPAAYAELAKRGGDAPTRNAHNEFLMIVAQFGLAGLVLFLALFGTQWWLAARLPGRFDRAAARGLVLTIVVASILTSTLVDHAEGFFFAYMSGLLFAGYGGEAMRGGWRAAAGGDRRSLAPQGPGASAAGS